MPLKEAYPSQNAGFRVSDLQSTGSKIIDEQCFELYVGGDMLKQQ